MHSFIYITYWSNYYCLYAHGHSLKNGQLTSGHNDNKRVPFPTKPSSFSSSSPTEAGNITFYRSFFSFYPVVYSFAKLLQIHKQSWLLKIPSSMNVQMRGGQYLWRPLGSFQRERGTELSFRKWLSFYETGRKGWTTSSGIARKSYRSSPLASGLDKS